MGKTNREYTMQILNRITGRHHTNHKGVGLLWQRERRQHRNQSRGYQGRDNLYEAQGGSLWKEYVVKWIDMYLVISIALHVDAAVESFLSISPFSPAISYFSHGPHVNCFLLDYYPLLLLLFCLCSLCK